MAAIALAGCSASVSTSDKLKTNEAEAQIAKGLEQRVDGKVVVSCPDDVTAKKGGTFTCKAKADDGSVATVKVIQKDDQGNIAWTVR